MQTQPQDGRFFVETGHWVSGPFLEYYESVPDPLLILGYPLTEQMAHPIRQGVIIQFFQRARLELNTNVSEAQQEVNLAPLGEWLYSSTGRGELANFAMATNACRTFPESGIPVCYAFLQFYDGNNGAVYFGEPVSQPEIIDGRLVQYFERARMEWRPEMPNGQRVALTDLGRLDFDLTIGNDAYTEPLIGIPEAQLVDIRAHAFAEHPLIGSGERQTVFVVVVDQYMRPVADAQVMVTVRMPNGSVENLRPDRATNEDGFTQVDFSIPEIEPNQVVEIQAEANVINGPQDLTTTWFRVWW